MPSVGWTKSERSTYMKLPFEVNLKGKVVVVTGAGGVICSYLAKSIAACGAKLALLNRHKERAQLVADEIIAEGGEAKAYEVNVLDKESIEKCHQEILKDFGKCDILLNGAGGNDPKATTDNEFAELDDLTKKDVKTFFSLEESGVEFVFNLNFLGTLLPTQIFAPDMMGREGCSILNVASMNAYTPLTKIPAYSGAKAAVKNFTEWLAVHFAHVGIRVNAIAPGFFATKQNEKLLFNPDGTPTARTGKILAATPAGRFGQVEDLVGATLFLLSAEGAGFVTGVCIPIDGGFSSYSGV